MSNTFIVQCGACYLTLVGPFEYASWHYSTDGATIMSRVKAREWADVYGGIAVRAEVRTRIEPEAVATFTPPTLPSGAVHGVKEIVPGFSMTWSEY